MKPEWDYSSDPLQNDFILSKNKEIWKVVGQKVCKYYTDKGNTIVYTDYIEKHISFSRNHLILMLDESGNNLNLF